MEPLPVSCPACWHPIQPDDAYCPECGSRIVASNAAAPAPMVPAAPPDPAPAESDEFIPLRIMPHRQSGSARSSRRSRPFWRGLSTSR